MNISLLQQTLNKLKLLGHVPTKRFGQNFLVDQNVVNKFVRLANIKTGDIVAEIGPGLGTVSEAILSYGAELYTVELDKRLFNFLKTQYAQESRFHIMNGDAVKYPIADLANYVPGESHPLQNGGFNPAKKILIYKIVASLPYSISSAWFDALLDQPILPDLVAVIIQLDAANRFLAQSGTKSFCATSIFLQSAYSKIEMYKMSRRSFYPIPEVDSVMLFLQKKEAGIIFNKQTKQLIRSIFQTRRKQIATIARELQSINPTFNLDSWIQSNNIAPNLRPEQIPLRAWQNI